MHISHICTEKKSQKIMYKREMYFKCNGWFPEWIKFPE